MEIARSFFQNGATLIKTKTYDQFPQHGHRDNRDV